MSQTKRQLRTEKAKPFTAVDIIGHENFTMIPIDCLTHAPLLLSPHALRVFMILVSKLRGKKTKKNGATHINTNNGDLSITHKELEAFGIGLSKRTFFQSINELVDKGFIVITRQGGRNKCNLYAVTFQIIGDIRENGSTTRKIDHAPTLYPSNEWRQIAINKGLYIHNEKPE
ncbi:hypothetical protein [Wohlfahrtiimonas chitiniclastica]|uniref:hypothetical protein n=1 Tax=Wohlfahrtiimonas chitiniclastica TaxID=400946 RepID=UPI002157D14A|nr:hypothetical protein [Wohlfahrtiimonas chitiniclastica]MDC7251842.1 hypothetical protein [Wohlfahrtiimonas chitiniclastica]